MEAHNIELRYMYYVQFILQTLLIYFNSSKGHTRIIYSNQYNVHRFKSSPQQLASTEIKTLKPNI